MGVWKGILTDKRKFAYFSLKEDNLTAKNTEIGGKNGLKHKSLNYWGVYLIINYQFGLQAY